MGAEFGVGAEGLPALSLKVLQTLVKRSRERIYLTGEEENAILEEYSWKCATCGSKGQLEFDHTPTVIPRQYFGTKHIFGHAQFFRALCFVDSCSNCGTQV